MIGAFLFVLSIDFCGVDFCGIINFYDDSTREIGLGKVAEGYFDDAWR